MSPIAFSEMLVAKPVERPMHTQGPLVLSKRGMGVIKGGPSHQYANGSSQSQLFLAMVGQDMSDEERDANADRVIKCWNSHDDLLAALREAREFVNQHSEPWYQSGQRLLATIDKALAKAEQPCS